MPSDKPERVLKWRHPVSAVQTLSATAFAEKVIEHGLRAVGPYQGYMYAALETDDGYDMFRTPQKARYFWSYRQACTQDNAGGGNLIAIITPAVNSAFIPFAGSMIASGNRAVTILLQNGDGNTIGNISVVGAVAGAQGTIAPAPGAYTATAVGQSIHEKPIAYPNAINAVVTSAAQTETATLVLYGELLGTSTAPTVSWATSGGTPNAAAASENTVTTVQVSV
jgi:hypothetical protein